MHWKACMPPRAPEHQHSSGRWFVPQPTPSLAETLTSPSAVDIFVLVCLFSGSACTPFFPTLAPECYLEIYLPVTFSQLSSLLPVKMQTTSLVTPSASEKWMKSIKTKQKHGLGLELLGRRLLFYFDGLETIKHPARQPFWYYKEGTWMRADLSGTRV